MIEAYYLDSDIFKDEGLYCQWFCRLPEDRKRKVQAYKFEKDRRLSLAAGLILKYGLGKYGIKEGGCAISVNQYGKAYLKNTEGICFNLSHSGKYAAGAFSRYEVGIDIERIQKQSMELAKRFYAPQEYEFILQQPPHLRDEMFTRLWCLKESYIKAIGLGMSMSLDSFYFIIDEKVKIIQNYREKEFIFHEAVLEDYKLAVCGEEEEFRLRDITENFISCTENVEHYGFCKLKGENIANANTV